MPTNLIDAIRRDLLQTFTGYQILESNIMTEYKQVRFPRSKKKRIQKKWRKRPANYAHVPMQYALKYDNTLLMHPDLARKLEAIILNPKPLKQRTRDQLLRANTFPIWDTRRAAKHTGKLNF